MSGTCFSPYNIFEMANISPEKTPEEVIAQYFRVLGQPIRIQILLILEKEDACVCHLEAHLGIRQAQISQHLMVLRDAGIVSFYRDGRNIYYQLAHRKVLPAVRQVAQILGLSPEQLDASSSKPVVPCPCPHCNPETTESLDCSHLSALK